ncbi:MAG: hypothetical protein NTW97_03320 [Candidatus Krumholzibacteria bacterium]|nr:hypothetical protein [Candidatus Krumholzibacteria bacterium]
MNDRVASTGIWLASCILFIGLAATEASAENKEAAAEPTLPVEEKLIHEFGWGFFTSLDGLQTTMRFSDNGREEEVDYRFNTDLPLVDPAGGVVKLKDVGVPRGIYASLTKSWFWWLNRGEAGIVFRGDSLAVIYSGYTGSGSDKEDGGIFINGIQVAGPYDWDAVKLVSLSPDCRRFALALEEDKKWKVIIRDLSGSTEERIAAGNGIPFDKIGELLFSRDGGTLAYTARQGKEWFVYVGEIRAAGPYPQIGSIALSADGRSPAYAVKLKKKWQVMGDMIPPSARGYDEIGAIDISPSGRHIAYSARKGAEWLAVVDNVEVSSYIRIGAGPVHDPTDANYLWAGSGGKVWGANPHFVDEDEVEFMGWKLPRTKDSQDQVFQVHVDVDSLVR